MQGGGKGPAANFPPCSNAGGNKESADGIAEGLFFNPVVTEERKAAAFATFLKTNLTASAAEACGGCASTRGASKEGQPLRQGQPSLRLPFSSLPRVLLLPPHDRCPLHVAAGGNSVCVGAV